MSKAKGGESSKWFSFSFNNQKYIHPFMILGKYICNVINMNLVQIESHLGILLRKGLKAIENSPHGHWGS